MPDKEYYSVKQQGRWGFIDRDGNVAIRPQFDYALDFADARAVVRKGDKWGYIDLRGDLAIDARFDDARTFSEGFATAKIGPSWGVIDVAGDWLVQPRFADAGTGFSEGLLFVQVGESWGIINGEGDLVVPPRFATWSNFREGLAYTRNSFDEPWVYVDKNGQPAMRQTYERTEEFSEGLAFVDAGETAGFIDRDGKMVLSYDSELLLAAR